ncbi:hypothetical protein N9881_00115 [bacterium]|nr:hypothetical protein [bacterium]
MRFSQLVPGALLLFCSTAPAIEIVLDFTLDEQNSNWFNPNQADSLARRQALESAAQFLSEIILNDDWNALPTLNEGISFSDIRDSSIKDLDGSTIFGTPETDGTGYRHTMATSNRSAIGANTYIVYVGAFFLDSGTTALAIGGWDSADRRNAAGSSEIEFNTWGGRIWFNMDYSWYAGSNPGINPVDSYGFQGLRKTPPSDITSDNWDWDPSAQAWEGFQLRTIDP